MANLLTQKNCLTIAYLSLLVVSAPLLISCQDSAEGSLNTTLKMGEQVFTQNCAVCHSQGINGAPILGNKIMWQPRRAQSEAVLLEHAMNGYGLMPAKGGKEDLDEKSVQSAIAFMLSKLPPP